MKINGNLGLTDEISISYTANVSSEIEQGVSAVGNAPVELTLNNRRSSESKVDWRDSEGLNKNLDRQIRELAKFADKLGKSPEEYTTEIKKILSGFTPIPESFEDPEILAEPILVDPRFSWSDLLGLGVDLAKARQARSRRSESQQPELDFEHLRINPMFDLQDLEDWTEGDFQTPTEPYTTWLANIPNVSVEEVRSNINEDLRGGTLLDGIMLYYKDTRILNKYFIKFPGSQVGPDHTPFLSALPFHEGVPNHPSLNRGSNESKHPKSACLIASKT